MWDYIVLGQVPGTSVQISFENWLFGMACLPVLLALYLITTRLLRRYVFPWLRFRLLMLYAGLLIGYGSPNLRA